MKEGWQVRPLGSVCDVLDSARKPITKRHRSPGPYPYYGATGALDYVAGYLFDERLVLVGEDGAKWGAGELSAYMIDGRSWVNNHAHVLRMHRDVLIDEWLTYFLNCADLAPFVAGLTVPKLTQASLRAIPVPLPPLAEQQRIVAILDEALSRRELALTNAESGIAYAHAILARHLRLVFQQPRGPVEEDDTSSTGPHLSHSAGSTKSTGRAATTRHIPPALSLAVTMPRSAAREGWRWTPLTSLARLESGHTPSRRHPEWWGGEIPWLTLSDARPCHGRRITDTREHINELGLANSSARLLPPGTVCLSRTASVGYVVVMDSPMATSQDFVNWVCSRDLDPDFLKYLFLAEGRSGFRRFSSGSVHQTIYFPEVKAFHVCVPVIDEQRRIVEQCDEIAEEGERLASIYRRKLAALEELKASLLHLAFSGNL